MKAELGVVGYPIAHSLSPQLHNATYQYLGFAANYQKFEVPPGKFIDFIKNHPELAGLSITMPHKFAAFSIAENLDKYAELTGAANTLKRNADKTWAAYNTDVYGIIQALSNANQVIDSKDKVAVLGGGATAMSAFCALAELGFSNIELFLRSPNKALDIIKLAKHLNIRCTVRNLNDVIKTNYLISTLPQDAIKAYKSNLDLTETNLAFDVNYNPWPSELAKYCETAKVEIIPGIEMLLHQAVRQVQIFTGTTRNSAEILSTMSKSVKK
ncbi:MAG: shikimate dehydrogenase [Micrococcaceae bacterium]